MFSEFHPAQSPTTNVQSALAGFQTGQSLWERQHAMRLDRQRAEMQQVQFDAALPALVAKSRADIAQANAALEGARATEDARRRAFEVLPQARSEFDSIMSLTDPGERADAALAWASRYSHFENVGPLGAEFKSKNLLAKKLIEDGRALIALREQLGSRERIARLGADSRKMVGMPTLEKLRVLRDQAEAEGDAQGVSELDAAIAKANRVPTPTTDADRIRTLLREADDAEKAGDTTLATALRNRVQRLTAPKDDVGMLRDEVLSLLSPKGSAAPAPKSPTPATPTAPGDVESALNSIKF